MAIVEAAFVDAGVVTNRTKFDDADPLPAGWIVCPPEVAIGWIDNGDGSFSPPPSNVPDPLSQQEIRDELLRLLVHDFGDGRVIQCRPTPFFGDESNMRNAIEIMNRKAQSSRSWFDVNNTKVTVTIADLQAVIISGQDQADTIWTNYHDGLL